MGEQQDCNDEPAPTAEIPRRSTGGADDEAGSETRGEPADRVPKTMIIDCSQQSEPGSGGETDDGAFDETMAIDVSSLRREDAAAGRPVDNDGSTPPTKTMKIELGDQEASPAPAGGESREVEPFPFDRLDRVTSDQSRGLGKLAAVLPEGLEREEWTGAVEERMEELVERSHRIAMTDIGTVVASGRSFEIGRGIWTWGRMPPRHCRFVVGVGRRLADSWIRLAGPDQRTWADDFEFGLVTFLVAEFCAVLTERAGWSSWSWAVNPMSRRELRTMLVAEASPLLEVTFEVGLPDGGGWLRLWLPISLVRRLPERGSPAPVVDASDETGWWAGLSVENDVVAGTATVRDGQIERLNIGDILVVDRHGVAVGEVGSSAVETGAWWSYSADRGVVGELVEGPGDGWQLRVRGTRLISDSREDEVTESKLDTEQQPEDSLLSIPVDEAEVEVEVRIGSAQMSLQKLAGLRRGEIVDCDVPLGSPVDLVVRGARVGRGELVNVDGNLGVRILSTKTE